MATLTRTTFQPTAARVTPATVRGARQQTIERVSNQVSRRAVRQIAAAQQSPNAPALAAPGGLVQRPGGEPLRPRATQATGATPVGAAVQFNQGILTGTPLVGGAGAAPNLDMNRAILVEGDPNGSETAPRITPRSRVDWAINTVDATVWYWENSTSEWLLTAGGGSQIIYGTGNPNGTLMSQASAVPWVANGQYYDKVIQRLYVAWENNDDLFIKWVPVATHTFDASTLGDSGVYPGDMYQAPDGAFYRLNHDGNWVMQYVCPDCGEMPDPPPDPCSPVPLYGSGAIAEGATQYYYPC